MKRLLLLLFEIETASIYQQKNLFRDFKQLFVIFVDCENREMSLQTDMHSTFFMRFW